jgi:hypothetical protein
LLMILQFLFLNESLFSVALSMDTQLAIFLELQYLCQFPLTGDHMALLPLWKIKVFCNFLPPVFH